MSSFALKYGKEMIRDLQIDDNTIVIMFYILNNFSIFV